MYVAPEREVRKGGIGEGVKGKNGRGGKEKIQETRGTRIHQKITLPNGFSTGSKYE